MKHPVIALKRHNGAVTVDGDPVRMKLPTGCTGLVFCFESKKAARAYWGTDVGLNRVEMEEKDGTKS